MCPSRKNSPSKTHYGYYANPNNHHTKVYGEELRSVTTNTGYVRNSYTNILIHGTSEFTYTYFPPSLCDGTVGTRLLQVPLLVARLQLLHDSESSTVLPVPSTRTNEPLLHLSNQTALPPPKIAFVPVRTIAIRDYTNLSNSL